MTVEKPLDEKLKDFEERMKKRQEAEEEEARKIAERLRADYERRRQGR